VRGNCVLDKLVKELDDQASRLLKLLLVKKVKFDVCGGSLRLLFFALPVSAFLRMRLRLLYGRGVGVVRQEGQKDRNHFLKDDLLKLHLSLD